MESSIEKKNQTARILLNKAHGSNNRVYLALGSLKKSWGVTPLNYLVKLTQCEILTFKWVGEGEGAGLIELEELSECRDPVDWYIVDLMKTSKYLIS